MTQRNLLRLIILVAVLVRLGYALTQGLTHPPRPGSDEFEYDRYAWNLVQGNGYRGPSPDVSDQDHLTAYRTPGPSLAYAALYLVGGHRPILVRLFNILLSAFSCGLIVLIGRRVFSEKIGLMAAAAWAIWPTAVFNAVGLWSEPLSTFLYLLLFLAAFRFADSPGWREAALVGLLLGLNLLSHASRVLFIPFLGLWVLVQFRSAPRVWLRATAIPLVAALCLAPWTIRNWIQFHHFIPFSTMGGSVLLQGNNRIVATDPEYWGYNIWDTNIPEYADQLRAPNDEIQRDQIAGQLAKQWISENRALLPGMLIKKVARGWTPLLQARTAFPLRLIMLLSWGPVLLLLLIGLIPTARRFLRERNPGILLHFALLDVVVLNLIFFGFARYRLPVEPFALLLAAWTLTWLAAKLHLRVPGVGETLAPPR